MLPKRLSEKQGARGAAPRAQPFFGPSRLHVWPRPAGKRESWRDEGSPNHPFQPGSKQRTGALVIGGDYRGLGVVRSLGRQGIPVWVLTDEHTIAATSRYAQRSLRWPAGGEAEQIAYLLELGRIHQLEGWTIFPTGDETAWLLAHYQSALAEHFRLTTPTWESMCWCYDKRSTYQLGAELGLASPWTYSPSNREEIAALDCPFPAILKPAYKRHINRFTYDKAWQVEGRAELLLRYDDACKLVASDIIMVQELIPGGGESQFSYAALCVDGQPRASLVARRTRQYPVDFGRSSSYVETVDRPEVEELARRLIAAIEYTGLIEVEFKYDARDGRYKLLEVNPRVWGWHTIGARVGVDFPYLLWQLAQGKVVPELRGRPGVGWVRMVTDLLAGAQEMRRGNLSLRGYLQSLSGSLEYAILATDDPLPALAEIPLLCYISWKRWLSRKKSIDFPTPAHR